MTKPSTAVKPADKAATVPAVPTVERHSVVRQFAQRLGVDAGKLISTLKDTAFKSGGDGVTDAQMVALLVVANEYQLNPFTKEIYAFPAKGGGIVPIVSIDGWIRIINTRPELEYIEFAYSEDDGDKATAWAECSIKRRDRVRPVTVREYYAECYRNTDPWNTMGRRMLRHKALIQCGRVAFGYGGIYDPDEGRTIAEANAVEGEVVQPTPKPATREPQAKIAAPAAPATATHEEVLALLDSTGVPLSEVLAHFEAGELTDLNATQCAEAIEWIRGLNAAP